MTNKDLFPIINDYLQTKLGSKKEFPFGDEPAVFKVGGKMFALLAQKKEPLRLTLKCDPLEIDIVRMTFAAVNPGYHMNKDHWNTITLDGSMPNEILFAMIDDSYDLILSGLSKRIRESI
ncbi:MAG: MmcQ/YjbR family DNA-binding protein [Candidatus Marinimicrobia bacterium]|nr:MmcQ/YjbR family DNA-binding protein [Candidatus Neomarinimicrobiota bacterium]